MINNESQIVISLMVYEMAKNYFFKIDSIPDKKKFKLNDSDKIWCDAWKMLMFFLNDEGNVKKMFAVNKSHPESVLIYFKKIKRGIFSQKLFITIQSKLINILLDTWWRGLFKKYYSWMWKIYSCFKYFKRLIKIKQTVIYSF